MAGLVRIDFSGAIQGFPGPAILACCIVELKQFGQRPAILVLAIGLSRLYLGVHYFSDVVGGYAVGIVWLAACISGVELALGQRGLQPWEVGVERRGKPREMSTGEAPL